MKHLTLLQKAATLFALSLIPLGAHAALDPAAPSQPASAPATPSPSLPISQPQAAGAEEDIFDIRGPIHIPAKSSAWIYWSAGALAVAGLGVGAWLVVRRPHRKQPYEIALEKLAATQPLMERETAEPFSLAVSEIVRLFIEECLNVRAAHRTTHEFLHDLVNLPDSPLSAHREALGAFLEHCDLAKFAKWSLTVPQMEAMLYSASAFVVAIGKPESAKKKAGKSIPAPIVNPTKAHA